MKMNFVHKQIGYTNRLEKYFQRVTSTTILDCRWIKICDVNSIISFLAKSLRHCIFCYRFPKEGKVVGEHNVLLQRLQVYAKWNTVEHLGNYKHLFLNWSSEEENRQEKRRMEEERLNKMVEKSELKERGKKVDSAKMWLEWLRRER